MIYEVFDLSKNRKLIIDIIKSSAEHMTAGEIFIKARQKQPSIAVGTVYRNLGLMTKSGEIKRVVIPNMSDRFDKFTHSHEHIICQKCGALSDITVSNLKEYLEAQTGIEITGYELSLKNICDKCKETTKGA